MPFGRFIDALTKSRIGVENEEINFFALSIKRGGRRVIAWRKPRDSAAFTTLLRGVRLIVSWRSPQNADNSTLMVMKIAMTS